MSILSAIRSYQQVLGTTATEVNLVYGTIGYAMFMEMEQCKFVPKAFEDAI